ncbi:MAG TPA: cupin domain-containing protein [Turneriella sp.]|nr:cupin domain-containing protein [Turneriella sp.]HNJ65356.1 cupin domain-containing protein [Turneriella sp.]HNL55753.1 cupin domain-containing protein [Turneriella sp.]
MNKIESIHDRIVMKSEAKSSTVLFTEGFKVVGLGFMAGQKLAQHSSPSAAFLLVHQGNINFTMGGTTVTMKTGDFIAIPAKEEHEILATEDSRILLTKGV